MLRSIRYYGSSAIGDKGQIVIPAGLRKSYIIKPGDKFLILAGEKLKAWGIILVKSDVLTKVMRQIFAVDQWTDPKEPLKGRTAKGIDQHESVGKHRLVPEKCTSRR